MKKILSLALPLLLAAVSARADLLFQDSTNYPYTDGSIEGQGQWYCYYPSTPHMDVVVTNNVLLLNTTNKDSVGTPTNGWVNPTEYNYASFTINVSQLPSTANGSYFCQFQNLNDTNDVCHIFIDTLGTTVPGTFRLGVANFATTFNSTQPPINYPLDLATGVTYTVVFLYDTNQANETFVGSTLWINPSLQDYQNVVDGDDLGGGLGNGFVYGTDTTSSQAALNINIQQIGLSPYANAGISNVIVGTAFTDVNTTNPPVIGVQPQSGTNYSGNSTTFYTAASGVDLTYQWFSSTTGALVDDGVNIVGSQSNILVLNNLSVTDSYYVTVTDAYGNTATSDSAVNTVITTPTAPFFTGAGVNLTNNLFTYYSITNLALGTGPLTYQWYFAPTNTPGIFSPLSGQTSSVLIIPELEYPNAGNYYVSATGPDGTTAGPTNNLVIVAPVVATLPQLHELMALIATNITSTAIIPINTNGVTVTGYITTFGPLTATTAAYSEFYIGYQGYGIYAYYGSAGTNAVPAPGTYVSVTGPVQVYKGQLEIDPGTNNGVVIISNAPVQIPAPTPGNFALAATNALGAYGLQAQCSVVTFTNVYIYGSKTGAAYTGNGGIFYSNGYTALYITQGPYNNPANTNIFELYVPAYGFGAISTNLWGQKVPAYAYQLTGILANYKGTSELDLTRYQDIVTNASPFAATLSLSNHVATVAWPAQSGSTYTVYSSTNLSGPWTNAFGLSYYPTTGIYTDTNSAKAKFYRISTP